MLLLATAYALIEEAYTTQSLFNPDYVGARLLDYGYIPALGTSLNWSLFVLSIHVVWSVATPILIAEGIAGARRTEPWLKIPGLAVTVLLFLIGCALTTNFSLHASPFRASAAQVSGAGVLVVIALAAALVFKPVARADAAAVAPAGTNTTSEAAAPAAWIVFAVTFVLAVAFIAIESIGRGRRLVPGIGLAGELACEAIALVLIARWSRLRGWGALKYLAIAAGTSLAYALFGLYAFAQGHTHLGAPTGAVDIAGQIVLTLLIFALIGWGARRNPPARPIVTR
jgi:hypothetical protein